ncbi:MAG: bifunctional diaminohydroxyphosphoribosylaminopyrimidine deaminase/5-amino-6-(5-phosphoribosylamino)uracil reductase RibD [Pelagibacteraceae bacterium]
MATKKDNNHFKNNQFIRLAFEQAKINLGSTGQNPSVGCVVERNGAVISSGRTSINGRPHAEFNALKKLKKIKDLNIYLSLEPCSHYGITPPCTNLIIKNKIKKVFFSLNDVDKRSSRKSYSLLKKKKIFVKGKILEKYAKNFYKSYILNKLKKKSLIDAKLAISKDFYSINKKSKWITNSYSRNRVHLLRSKYDCIITTSKTINKDNSMLDCRIVGLDHKSPAIFIIDRYFKIKTYLKIFKKLKRPIYLITSLINQKKEKNLKKRGVKIIRINDENDFIFIKQSFYKINNLGFSRLFVESGLIFLSFLLKNKFINNIYIFQSKMKLKNKGYNNISNKLIKSVKLKNKIKVNLNGDQMYKIFLKNV